MAGDEDGARRARHEFFAKVAAQTGIQKLALAHTADDQVETFLLRLLRGAGVPGLVGIWPERQLGKLRVILPMLKVRRTEVLEYLSAQGLKYREDASNADTRFTRNRIRHELLPLLERDFNPAIREVLLHTAEILRDEDFYLLHHVAQRFYMTVCQNDAVNVKALANCPVAIQRRVLRFWLGGDARAGRGLPSIKSRRSVMRRWGIRPARRLICRTNWWCTANTSGYGKTNAANWNRSAVCGR